MVGHDPPPFGFRAWYTLSSIWNEILSMWDTLERVLLMAILAGTRHARPDGWHYVWGGTVWGMTDWQPGLWDG